jgi:hypothetical protein
MTASDRVAAGAVALKAAFTKTDAGSARHLSEVIPLESSHVLEIEKKHLEMLHRFAQANPVYSGWRDVDLLGVPCRAYEGDINHYWLGSIKHDTSYQAFYPTWMLSAYALALRAQEMGFAQAIDVGSGDGRISYCAALLGMAGGAHGIEIDGDLAELQRAISKRTGVPLDVHHADATRFDYSSLVSSSSSPSYYSRGGATGPAFFISANPEMGEMLAGSVISRVLALPGMAEEEGGGGKRCCCCCCFVFMGSHQLKKYSRDLSMWGWGQVIRRHGLAVAGTLTLPARWTMDQQADTPYVFAVPQPHAAADNDNNDDDDGSSGNSDGVS